VSARDWNYTTIRQIYMTPSIAGIAVYNGAMRKENQQGQKSRFADPESVALKDSAGNYIMGQWKPILEVADWKALIDEWQRRRAGLTFSAAGTKKHLLSGLLRCGCIRPDGSVCNRPMTGTRVYFHDGRPPAAAYRCPGKNQGGCAGVQRRAALLDKLIEDLLFAHIAANAPAQDQPADIPDDDDPDAIELAGVQKRLFNLRTGYAQGTVSDDSMFNIVPALEARERQLKAELAKKAKTRISRIAREKSPEDVRREWDQAVGDVGIRRAILSRYLKAIIVRKSRRHGPGDLDYSAIEPVWRADGDTPPGDYLT
jgi:site-specific DNA recombinase